ncbi:MAG: hypothetical protein R2789_07835 [Microthrixaceae bacterium]
MVLITGIGGGVWWRLSLALHLGAEVVVTSRDPLKRERALLPRRLGPPSTVPMPSRCPRTSWSTALGRRSGSPPCGLSGREVGCVSTEEPPDPRWNWSYPGSSSSSFEIIGATCGSQGVRDRLSFMADGLEVVDEILPLAEYPRALERLKAADQLGKIVLEHP